MLSALTIFVVFCAAILFGIFFLIFKLIWVLFNKKQNFWPLVLSGVVTLLCILAVVIACWKTYNHFIQPLRPIMSTAEQRTQPVYGEEIFTDPIHQFSLTLHDGMVMSDWIDAGGGNEVLIGLDLNPFTKKQMGLIKQGNPEDLRGILILTQPQAKQKTALQFFNDQLLPEINSDANARQTITLTAGPTPVDMGPNANAAYVRALIHSEKLPQDLPLIFMAANRGTEMYYIVGVGYAPVDNTVLSFAFDK